MRTRVGKVLMLALLVGVLTGCATTGMESQYAGYSGMPNAEHPEYFAHPFRIVALFAYPAGNLLQYGLVEPLYFAVSPIPQVVGLTVEEQRYLEQRKEAWRDYFWGRPATP